MRTLDEARALILAGVAPTGPEIVSLADAAGRVTASAIRARVSQPAHDVSAMDGYAVRAADTGANAILRVIAAAPAGHPTAVGIGPGDAIRIFTGSVMPQGADAVLIQENCERVADTVRLHAHPPDRGIEPGRHVRPRGGDFGTGDIVIPAGLRLAARMIGLAAASGHPWLAVRRRPRVALLATGDEIVLPGEPIPRGGLPSSNSFALAALVAHAGGEAVILPIAPDDPDAIAAIAATCRDCDLLLTIGGASVGDHDLVRPALARHGFQPDVWKIAMRPGKPLMHGHLQFGDHRVKVLGLPGNPVSALTTALLFALPVLARMLGLPDDLPRRMRAILGADLPGNDQRADHLRATVERRHDGTLVATAFQTQDSARAHDFAKADALILRAPHAPACRAGEAIEIILLADHGL